MAKASWINQKDIDRKRWDELVKNTDTASVNVLSWLLDSTAIDWEAYLAEDYSFAIPVGVTRKGGVSRVYPPLFHGFIEPIGEINNINWNDFETSLLKRFKKGDLVSNTNLLTSVPYEESVYQVLSPIDFTLKTQAKRKIRQFEKSALEIREHDVNTNDLQHIIIEELGKKLPVFQSKEVNRLFSIVQHAEKKKMIYKVGIFDANNNLFGGLIGIEYNNVLLYLKGAAKEEALHQGGMYALMNQFIHHAVSKNNSVDFGGSRVKGIRFFNQRFNGKDLPVYHYSWDFSPWWWRKLYQVYQKVKS